MNNDIQKQLASDIKVQKQIDGVIKDMPSYVVEWCYYLRASDNTLLSCYDYIRKVRKFLNYINTDVKHMNVEEITADACESYLIACQTRKDKNGMEILTSNSYQRDIRTALQNFLNFLVQNNYIEYNYLYNIQKNTRNTTMKKPRVVLTQRDFNKILSAAKEDDDFMNGILKNRNVLIILLFMTTGMKKTSMSELNINDIDFQEHTLSVVDSKCEINVYELTDQVIDYINKWLEDRKQLETRESGDALFLQKDGTRLGDDSIYNIVKKSCYKGIGKKLSPQQLRIGFCAILYKRTLDVDFVQKAVGYKYPQSAQRYIPEGGERKKATKIISGILNI